MLTLLPDDPLALGVLDELRYRDTTLSKSARLGPAQVMTACDLGCPSSVVRAERFRTQANEARA